MIQEFLSWITSGPLVQWTTERRQGRRTSIIIHLNELFDGDEGRRTFLKWAFGVTSVKDLKDSELARLWEWLGPNKDEETGEWTIRAKCCQTAATIKREIMIEAGQVELPL